MANVPSPWSSAPWMPTDITTPLKSKWWWVETSLWAEEHGDVTIPALSRFGGNHYLTLFHIQDSQALVAGPHPTYCLFLQIHFRASCSRHSFSLNIGLLTVECIHNRPKIHQFPTFLEDVHDLQLEPTGQFWPIACFVNKVLLEYIHVHSFIYCLWVLSSNNGRIEEVQQGLANPKIFYYLTLYRKICQTLFYMNEVFQSICTQRSLCEN